MEVYAIAGLILGFVGAVMMMSDPNAWLLSDYTKKYIKREGSIMTIPAFTEEDRTKLLKKLVTNRIGMVLLATGFFLQLVSQIHSYIS